MNWINTMHGVWKRKDGYTVFTITSNEALMATGNTAKVFKLHWCDTVKRDAAMRPKRMNMTLVHDFLATVKIIGYFSSLQEAINSV